MFPIVALMASYSLTYCSMNGNLEMEPKCIMGSLWANKIKFDEDGKFLCLGPRWCIKGFKMDRSIYTGFSEVCLTTTIKMMAAIRATYRVKDFLFDAS